MAAITRRNAILLGASAVTTALVGNALRRSSGLFGQDEISQIEREAMASVVMTFLEQFGVPGVSIAIARRGRLVYQEPFGLADAETGEGVSSSSLFRIASVSKPITSAAVFTLIEQGRLHLDDLVFGGEGILGKKYGRPPYKAYVEDVTVDHLLTHTCGGWDNGRNDPMFLDTAIDQASLISYAIDELPLEYPPGTHWAYSNFGYCLLGRIIETVSGQSYADYVRNEILVPCGIADMQIAGNTLQERAPNEVIYYGQNGEDPYNMNVRRMDAHGGWLSTPADLVRFASQIDGFNKAPRLLTAEQIAKMTTACGANQNYARGWSVNNLGNWWHTGSLPGTTAIMVRTANGFCWAALTNTRRQPFDTMDRALDDMVWAMVRQVRHWRV